MQSRATRSRRKATSAIIASALVWCMLLSGCAKAPQVVPNPQGLSQANAPVPFQPLNKGCLGTLYDALYIADPGTAPAFFNATVSFNIAGLSGLSNLVPLTFIQGPLTQLSQDYGMAVDDDANFYVSNHSTNAVTAYMWFSNGNVAPIGVIAGSKTGLNQPWDLDMDYFADTMYAVNGGTPSLTVYNEGIYGNVLPLRTISGPLTQLGDGEGIAVDNSGGAFTEDVYVTNKSAGKLLMFSKTASGNVAPLRVLAGPATGLVNPQGVAVDLTGKVYVSNTGGAHNNAVLVYAPGPSGNQAPLRIIQGSNTGLSSPLGVTTFDTANELFVSNPPANSITEYHMTDNGNVFPIATIAGSNTRLHAPAFIQYFRVCKFS